MAGLDAVHRPIADMVPRLGPASIDRDGCGASLHQGILDCGVGTVRISHDDGEAGLQDSVEAREEARVESLDREGAGGEYGAHRVHFHVSAATKIFPILL